MGNSVINCHLLLNCEKEHEKLFKKEAKRRGYILKAKDSAWTTYYDEDSRQDIEKAKNVGCNLSKVLSMTALVFNLFDSDVLQYYLIENGEIIDYYSSNSECFGEKGIYIDIEENAKKLCERFNTSCSENALVELLKSKEYTLEDERLEKLAKTIGIEPILASYGYDAAQDVKEYLGNKVKIKKIGKPMINKGFNELLDAILDEDVYKVKELITSGVDVNWEKGSVLKCAIVSGNMDILNILLNEGAKVFISEIKTAVLYLDRNHCKEIFSSHAKLNLENGVERPGDDIRRKVPIKTTLEVAQALLNTEESIDYSELLASAVDWKCQTSIEFLVKNGANINGYIKWESVVTDFSVNTTPLIFSVSIVGDIELTKYLLSIGADPKIKGPKGETFKEALQNRILYLEKRIALSGGDRYLPFTEEELKKINDDIEECKNMLSSIK